MQQYEKYRVNRVIGMFSNITIMFIYQTVIDFLWRNNISIHYIVWNIDAFVYLLFPTMQNVIFYLSKDAQHQNLAYSS